ncbi:MAG: kelch repeat-containing protein [Sphaerobacter sp.]|nr:kelch repeat-containing protein [Sphaerobacter sp.]
MTGRGGALCGVLAVWLVCLNLAGLPMATAAEPAWERIAPLPSGRGHLGVVSDAAGRIYAIGGQTGSTSETAVGTVERYDPGVNAWAALAPLRTARRSLGVARAGDGRIYALGGVDAAAQALGLVEVYDPVADRWDTVDAPLGTPRGNPAVATGHDGRIYVFGGRQTQPSPATLNTVEVFDPAGPSWSPAAPMPVPRWDAAATTGPDGRIYVIGGKGTGSERLQRVDIYDPRTDTWSPGPPLPKARGLLGAATGADGRIYVVGGEEQSGPVRSVLALDVGGATWVEVAPLAVARRALGVAATPGGVLYAVGGMNGSNQPVPATERYAPVPVGDGTPPVTDAALSGPSGAAGWFTGPVTVTLSATDAGAGVQQTRYQVDEGAWQTYTAPVTLAGDGTHTVAFASTDRAGNVEATQRREVRIDGTPPEIAGAPDRPPGAHGWYRAAVDIVFTCADATSGVAACPPPVTIDAEGRDQSAQGVAVDAAGNTATATVSGIHVDRTPPAITVELRGPDGAAVAPNAAGWFARPVTAVFSCADALSGMADCPISRVFGDGAGQIAEGVATDRAGNTARAAVAGINVDTVPPVVAVAYQDLDGNPVAPVAGWYPGPLRLVFTCRDDGSGVRVCPADRTLGAGADQQVSDAAEDAAGNRTSVELTDINVAGPAPSITYTLVDAQGQPLAPGPAGWYDRPVTVVFTCSGGTGGLTTCGPDQTLGEGAAQVVTGAAIDAAGNRAEVSVGPISVDLTPPVLDCQPPAADAWYADNVAVPCTARDDGAGLAEPDGDAAFSLRTAVPADEETAAAPSDARTVCDRVGQCAAAGPYRFAVDRRAPTLTAALVAGDAPYTPGAWTNQPVTVSFTCADQGAGVAPGSVTAPVTLSGEGAGQAVVGACTDRAGHRASLTVAGINIDQTAPQTTATLAGAPGDDGWYRGPVTVTLAATDAGGAGLAGISYQLDGGPAQPYHEPLRVEAEGTVWLRYQAADAAGNTEASGTVALRIDATPPVITCEEPDAPWYREGAAVACTAADGGSGLRDPRDAHFVLPVAPPESSPALASATRTVCDVAGNCATAGPVHLPVDDAAPAIQITAPAGTYLLNQEVVADYACHDDASGVVACDGAAPPGARIDTGRVGAHTFTVTARDAAGHVASRTATYQVRYGVQVLGQAQRGPLVWLRLRLVDAAGANQSAVTHRLRPVGLTVAGSDALTRRPVVRLVYVGPRGQPGEYLALVTAWRLPPGAHTVWFTVDDDPVPYGVAVSVSRPRWRWPW